jgi:hypothetical protein
MPALQQMVDGFRELLPVVGPQLKAAIASVDWKAFAESIVDTITFLVQNAEAIMRVVTALFILNTTYNVVKAATGLFNAAAVILGNTFTVTAGKIGLATGAVKLFRTALITTGIGAFVVALGFIIQGATEVDSSYRKTTPVVTSFGTAVFNSGKDAEWAANKYGTAKAAIEGLNTAASNYRPPNLSGVMASEARRDAAMAARNAGGSSGVILPTLDDLTKGTTGSTPTSTSFAATLQKSVVAQNRENKLVAKGLSVGAAQLALSTDLNKKQFTKLITNLSKPGIVEKRQTSFNKTAAGLSELASAAQAAESAAQAAAQEAAQAAAAAAQAAAEQAAREAAILAEKQRVYESFANAVTSTFSRIQESIVGAFSLPELGGSTDSIIRNMDKLLTRVKSFSTNISQLSSMGLDPALLQQVIQAGPVQGARLAASLVAGGADALGRINAGFGEIQTLGSEIGMTGTQSRFGTAQQQQIININIEGGLDSSAAIGKAVVDAVRAYERTSGAVWQGA